MSRNYNKSKPSNKRGSQGNDKYGKRDRKESSISKEQKTNNPSWYMTNSAIVEGVAQLPFNMPTGAPFTTLSDQVVSRFDWMSDYIPERACPGVAVFDVVPAFGNQSDASSSLNIASQAIYTWVRYYNSGARNYTPADLTIYLLANAQIYSMINWAMRIYGTISYYDFRNKYLGKTLIQAMGVDYNDFIGRMAEYRGRLNLLIDKASSFAVPNTMTYFLRTASMFTDIYTDGDTIKDQMYMYNPVGFYRFTFDTSETPVHDGAYLAFHTLTTDDHLMTVDDVINYLNDSIMALINSHDQGVISGDIYKAYNGNTLALATMGENYRTNFVHDDWVLNQIKNATLTSSWSYPDLYQNPLEGTVIFQPRISVSGTAASNLMANDKAFEIAGMHGSRVLTVQNANPDVAQVMEYTRMMTILDDLEMNINGNEYSVKGELICGSEIILRSKFYYAGPRTLGGPVGLYTAHYWNYCRSYTDTAGMKDLIVMDTLKDYFKYFPATLRYRMYSTQVGDETQVKAYYLGLNLDIDNYTLIDISELKHLHEVALMNMFATEAIAKLK